MLGMNIMKMNILEIPVGPMYKVCSCSFWEICDKQLFIFTEIRLHETIIGRTLVGRKTLIMYH